MCLLPEFIAREKPGPVNDCILITDYGSDKANIGISQNGYSSYLWHGCFLRDSLVN